MTTDPNLQFGRHPERGVADREVIDAILDTQLVCHVAFTVDGWPYAVPTVHARDGDRLLIHGSTLSRMLGGLAAGIPVCVTVTAVDGIVAARSAFNHSVNYRSVMVFGTAVPIRGYDDEIAAMRAIVEHVLPGRWTEVRQPSASEIRATEIVALPLDHATAKVRSGGPVDAAADRRRQVWSGVVPVENHLATPTLVPDDVAGLDLPASVVSAIDRWSR
jgi:nitroimidazol reductase NimA-like FMN-containing flavoprotein (pyridoxamine 5'-phosphate oxidase superfamily)